MRVKGDSRIRGSGVVRWRAWPEAVASADPLQMGPALSVQFVFNLLRAILNGGTGGLQILAGTLHGLAARKSKHGNQ